MKLGLLLASPPERPELAAVHRLARQALEGGNDVYLYLIDDGLLNLDRPEIGELRERGVKLFACAYGAGRRNIPWNPEKAVFSGLGALADIISSCDRFRAFTPLGSSPETDQPCPAGVLPRTLVTISEDPAQSHRPAEAIRIAAGLGGWNKTEVDVLLQGPSAKILLPDTDDFVDGDHFRHYLPILREWSRPVYLAPDAVLLDAPALIETPHEKCDAARARSLRENASRWIPF